MGRPSRRPGLYKRGDIWHIDKQIKGYGRIRESTGQSEREEADAYYDRRIAQIQRQVVHGLRPQRIWREAATKYLNDNAGKRSIDRDAQDLALLDDWIGDTPISQVHMGTLTPFIEHRLKQGRAHATINRSLAVVRRILNLSARLWRDGQGRTWLHTAPMIQLLDNRKKRKAYPLDRDEERLLFSHLADHLQTPCLYDINTGLREQEVCGLRWEWERRVSGMDGVVSVFVIPGELTDAELRQHTHWPKPRNGGAPRPEVLFKGAKNHQDRIVVHNAIAQSIIERQRGLSDEWVFPYQGKRRLELHTTSWDTARENAANAYATALGRGECPQGFRRVRVHDLKHTFGRRLRAAGVSFEDRQDLLGHKAGRVTTEYSAAEIGKLIDAANLACGDDKMRPSLTLMKVAAA